MLHTYIQNSFLYTSLYIGLDVLVNSAGIVAVGPTATIGLEDYDNCMNLNTRSAFVLTKAAIPHVTKTKGNMVHVSSVTGNKNSVVVILGL